MTNPYTLLHRAVSGDIPLTDADHDTLISWNRHLYGSLLRLPGLPVESSMGIIIRLLAITGTDITNTTRERENRAIADALADLPTTIIISGFLELTSRRVNNQRTSGSIRSYLFGTPEIESLAVKHRAAMRRILQHVMGRQVASTCLHFLNNKTLTKHESRYLRRHLWRYARDERLVGEVFRFLFSNMTPKHGSLLKQYAAARKNLEAGEGLPYKTLQGLAGTYHKKTKRYLVRRLATNDKVKREIDETADASDNTLVGSIRRYLRAPHDHTLLRAIEEEATRMANAVPFWLAKVAVVLDASASMRGVGHRLYNNLAIAIASWEVIRRRTESSQVFWIGGTHNDSIYPEPSGATSLAPVLLDAIKTKPDAVLLFTDGYENMQQGDAAAVLQGLKMLGIQTPVIHVMPAFTEREHLTDKQPLGDAPMFVETFGIGALPMWLKVRGAVTPERMPELLTEVLEHLTEVSP